MRRYFVTYSFYAYGHTRLASVFLDLSHPIVDNNSLREARAALKEHLKQSGECERDIGAIVSFALSDLQPEGP